jgi:methylated-DNA-[protein]-cysteine S-methyltransferase
MGRLGLSVVSSDHAWFGVLVDTHDRLVRSTFSRRKSPVERLSRLAEEATGIKPQLVSHRYVKTMIGLFDGQEVDRPVDYNPLLATDFQRRVYEVLRKVPKSRVTTYGLIAKAIGSGPRAVGTAVASNPWTLFVPCHRVVPFDRSVGNYSLNQRPDREGTRTKEELLRKEGVLFLEDRIHPESVWKPQ